MARKLIVAFVLALIATFAVAPAASANAAHGGDVENLAGASIYVWCKDGSRHIIYQKSGHPNDWYGLQKCGTVYWFMLRYDTRCVIDSNRYPEVGVPDVKYPVYLGHTIVVRARSYCHTTVRYDPEP